MLIRMRDYVLQGEGLCSSGWDYYQGEGLFSPGRVILFTRERDYVHHDEGSRSLGSEVIKQKSVLQKFGPHQENFILKVPLSPRYGERLWLLLFNTADNCTVYILITITFSHFSIVLKFKK